MVINVLRLFRDLWQEIHDHGMWNDIYGLWRRWMDWACSIWECLDIWSRWHSKENIRAIVDCFIIFIRDEGDVRRGMWRQRSSYVRAQIWNQRFQIVNKNTWEWSYVMLLHLSCMYLNQWVGLSITEIDVSISESSCLSEDDDCIEFAIRTAITCRKQ